MPGTEHRVQDRRAFRFSAPQRLDFSTAGLTPRSPPQLLLSFTEPVARNGLSLACNGCPLSRASIPGSTFPACYFAPCLLASTPGPPFSSTAPAGSPRPGAASQLLARCLSACWLDQPLPLPPLPFGTFTSLRIKAFNSFRCSSARLPTTPDLLSLPAAGSISRVGHGSTFLVRYVSGG